MYSLTGEISAKPCASLRQGADRYCKSKAEDCDEPAMEDESSEHHGDRPTAERPAKNLTTAVCAALILGVARAIEKREQEEALTNENKWFKIDLSKPNNYILRLKPRPEVLDKMAKEKISKVVQIKANTFLELYRKTYFQNSSTKQKYNSESSYLEEIRIAVQPETQCRVCEGKYPTSMQTDLCDCGHLFCKACLVAETAHKLENNKVLEISCLDPDCNSPALPDKVASLLNSEGEYILETKYKRFRNGHLALKWNKRLCPNLECWAILEEVNNGEYGSCNSCQINVCLTCNRLIHPGRPCEAAKQETEAAIAAVRKCPSCGVSIYKDRGCNHIICVVCKHQYCWICSKPYTHAHYSKFNAFGCPGLQFADASRWRVRFEKFKVTVFWVFFVLFFPAIYAGFLLILPVYFYLQRLKTNREDAIKKGAIYEQPSSCKIVAIIVLLALIGVPFMAVGLALTAAALPCLPIGFLCKACASSNKKGARRK